ncbi:MFS transporter [Methylocapsa sp. S129]|uniref:MFS transporter n=1 Tax=Methylocapsa sp. S129 TaxID=1641869 RepID=UPI00131A9402|nr:MFS transporter [Methylocapsa sp. S129]
MNSVSASPVARRTERAANSLIFLCNGLGIGAWAASMPLLQARLHLSDGALSLALLGFAAGAVLSMPMTGMLAPRLGVARATRFAALAFALAMFGPGLAPNFAALIGAAFVLGLTNGALDVSMNGLASGIETRWGGPIMSSFHAAFSVGGLGGAALGAAMATRSSPLVSAMSLVALINIVAVALTWRALRDPDAPPPAVAPRFVWPDRAALWLCGCVALGLLCEGAVGDWSAVYLANDLAAPPSLAAAGYAVFSAAMVIGRLGGDWFVARFGQARTVRLGGIASAVGIAGALTAPHPLASAIGFGLVGLGVSNVVPIVFSAAARAGSSPAAGVAMAASAGYSGLLLGPVLIGALATMFGLKFSLWLLAACACVIALTANSMR